MIFEQVITDAPNFEGDGATSPPPVEEVDLHLQVVIFNPEHEAYNWLAIVSIAIIIFLCIFTLKLIWSIVMRCSDDKRKKRLEEEQARRASLPSLDANIFRDPSAGHHRVSIPRTFPDDLEKKRDAGLASSQNDYLVRLHGDDQQETVNQEWVIGHGDLDTQILK